MTAPTPRTEERTNPYQQWSDLVSRWTSPDVTVSFAWFSLRTGRCVPIDFRAQEEFELGAVERRP